MINLEFNVLPQYVEERKCWTFEKALVVSGITAVALAYLALGVFFLRVAEDCNQEAHAYHHRCPYVGEEAEFGATINAINYHYTCHHPIKDSALYYQCTALEMFSFAAVLGCIAVSVAYSKE